MLINHARDYNVITHALLIILVTHYLSSSRLLRVTHSWFINHTPDCHVITHALLMIRVTHHLSSSRLLRVAHSWFINHARDYHVITHTLLMIRVTHQLPSGRLLRVTHSCWHFKPLDFQQWNINPLITFLLKSLIVLVEMHPAIGVTWGTARGAKCPPNVFST
jgi:hypothetical protein